MGVHSRLPLRNIPLRGTPLRLRGIHQGSRNKTDREMKVDTDTLVRLVRYAEQVNQDDEEVEGSEEKLGKSG